MKRPRHFLRVIGAAAAVWMAGCSTPAARIQRNPELFARLAPAEQALIRDGRIALGFTPEMVRLALGNPDHVHVRTDGAGTREIWSYTSRDAADEPYFYDGWYQRRRFGGWVGPYYPMYPRSGYGFEQVDFRIVFKEGKAVAVDQRRQ